MYGKKKFIAFSTVSMAFVVSAALCGNALIANADEYYTPQLRAALNEVGWSADRVLLKPARDFAGNEYVIGEAKDGNGHFIYNVAEEVLTEFTFKGESPYHGLYTNLIYGGAGSYFVQRGDAYVSVIESDVTYQSSEVLPYAAYREVAEEESAETAYSSVSTYANETINVEHPEFFYRNLNKHCGYFYRSGLGQCGFIALGMLIAYADQFEYGRIVNDSLYFAAYDNNLLGMISNNDNNQNCDRDKDLLKKGYIPLGEYLYNLHPQDSTTSMHIKETMNLFVEKRNSEFKNGEYFKIDYYSKWTPFYSNGAIAEAVKNNHPVILFGGYDYASSPDDSNIHSVGNHAIVCYGAIKTNKYYWRCHLGYNGANQADVYVVDGTIGSVYYFEIIEKGF